MGDIEESEVVAMVRFRSTLTAAAAVLALLVTGCSPVDRSGGDAAVEARTLRFAISGIDQVPEEGLAWAKEVEQSSGGTLKIEFVTEYAAGNPRGESEVIADVRSGAIDLGRVGARAFDVNGYDEFQPLLAPFLVDSFDFQARVFEAGIPARMAAGFDRIGLTPLAVLPGPFRRMMSRDTPFTSLSAYQGARINAAESKLAADVFAALGAQATTLPGGDLSGVDGFENLPASVWGNQFQSTWRHLTGNVNFGPRPWVFMANPDVFNSLAPSQQEALTGAAAATFDSVLRITADSDAEAVAKLCAAGVTFDVATDAQLDELEAAVRPVIDKLRTDPAKAAELDQIEALKLEVAAPPNTLTCTTTPSAQAADTLGIPDGTYTRTGTVGDIRRSGAEQRLKDIGFDFTGEPDSAGVTQTLVFADGLVTKDAVDTATGEPAGDREQWTYTTYRGRIRLSGPVDFVASYTYSDGELRFSDFTFPDPVGDFGYEVTFGFVPIPWVRQG
ncbi:MAG TPA: TRAP transporter substrate-binding protein DctP [Nakamurella sp.]